MSSFRGSVRRGKGQRKSGRRQRESDCDEKERGGLRSGFEM